MVKKDDCWASRRDERKRDREGKKKVALDGTRVTKNMFEDLTRARNRRNRVSKLAEKSLVN